MCQKAAVGEESWILLPLTGLWSASASELKEQCFLNEPFPLASSFLPKLLTLQQMHWVQQGEGSTAGLLMTLGVGWGGMLWECGLRDTPLILWSSLEGWVCVGDTQHLQVTASSFQDSLLFSIWYHYFSVFGCWQDTIKIQRNTLKYK